MNQRNTPASGYRSNSTPTEPPPTPRATTQTIVMIVQRASQKTYLWNTMSNGGEGGRSMVILGEVVCLVQDEKIMSSILDSTCWCGCTDAFIDAKVFKTMNVFKTMHYIVVEVSSFTIILALGHRLDSLHWGIFILMRYPQSRGILIIFTERHDQVLVSRSNFAASRGIFIKRACTRCITCYLHCVSSSLWCHRRCGTSNPLLNEGVNSSILFSWVQAEGGDE